MGSCAEGGGRRRKETESGGPREGIGRSRGEACREDLLVPSSSCLSERRGIGGGLGGHRTRLTHPRPHPSHALSGRGRVLTTWLVEDRNWLVLTDALKEVTIESMTLSNRWATSFSRSYRSVLPWVAGERGGRRHRQTRLTVWQLQPGRTLSRGSSTSPGATARAPPTAPGASRSSRPSSGPRVRAPARPPARPAPPPARRARRARGEVSLRPLE